MTDIINPDKTVITHNADVYWHYAGDPVQRSQLLGTFPIGAPQKVLLPIPADADIVLRAVPRGGRGQTFMAGPADATPVTISALGVGTGGGTSNYYQQLRVNHGYSSGYAPTPRPILNLLNAFQVKDDSVFGESDLSTFGVPTGLLNLRTDCNASGQIAVTTATVSGTDIVLATTLELQPGQGIFVKGAGVSGSDLVTSCLAVSADGKTITLNAGPFMPGPFTIVQADDTVAVQTWINSKGDLVMPPGYYRLTSSITLPTTSEGFSIVIHGAGWDLSVFAFQNTGDGFVSTSDLKIDSMVFTDLTIGTGTIGDASGTINPANQGIGVRMTAPSYTGIYNNFVMQRCRVLGWGRWGLWSDNLEVSWISQCIFRENKSGHVAFVGPDTISPNKQPNANTITDTTFDQAISAGPSDVKRDFTGSMTAGSRNLSGSGFTAADRGKFVIVLGAATGSPGGDLYTFIDTFNSSTSVTLAHQAQQNSSGTVHLFPVNVASVLLNRANDTVIDGSTIQGNFADAGSGATNVLSDVNAIKVYNSSNCRFIGIHEEDNAGPGGAAIRMENCYSMTIENWGGTSAGPPLFDNAHGADFQLLNSHCVRVSQCFFNDRPQFLLDGNTSEVEIDNSLIVGYINLWQQDASYDRLRIGSGVRVYQAADPRTNQVAGNEYSYDGFFGRNLIVNGRFLDGTGGMEGWTTTNPTWWSLTTTSKTRGGIFLNVDATGIAAGGAQTILHQAVPIPDTTGPGLFTLAFDWNLDSQNGVETTGSYVEIRLHPSSGIDEVSQFSTRRFTVVQDTWQVGHIRCFLGAGTSRTIDVQINVTPGPNNVIMHFANFRLAAGKHIYGAWEEGIHDFGGRMHAPIEFAHIATSGTGATAPPPVGATYASMVNDAGTMKLGYNGVWTNIGTGGSGTGVAAGTPNRFTIYNSSGSNIQNGPMQVTFGHVNIMSTGLWMDRTMPIFSVYPSGNAAKFVMIDTDDVVYLGPDSDTAGGVTGSNVTIRAGRGNSGTSVTAYKSTLQITGATGLFTLNNQRSANTTDTLRVTLPDLSMDGVVVQQPPGTTGMLYLGHPFAFRDLAGSATFFSVDHNGGIDFINSRQYTWPSTTPVVTGGVPMVLGYTTQTTANNPVTLSWMQMIGGTSSGHVIQDEGGPLPAQGALNFTGAGVTASNNATFPRTDVTIWTATPTQEGTVSISAQHFGGRKHFDNGLAAYDSVSVPIVAQYTGSTTGAHIQEWWPGGGTAIAYIDTQPVLRLGSPGLFDGFIELCSAVAGSQTVKLTCGIGATDAQVLRFPKTFPSVGQVLQVQTAVVGNPNVQLQWGTGGTGSGYSQIQEQGTNLPLRSILNFDSTGITAADDGTRTTVTLPAASTTQDGIVNNGLQTWAGRKTFNNGATMQEVAATQPVLLCKLVAGGGTSARVQEWQNSSATAIAYLDATPKFSMACDVLPDVDYPTTARSLGNSALRWAQIGCGQITWNSSNVRDIFGSGSPTGISAPAGCVYRNTLGTAGQTLWVRESAAWVAVGAGGGGGAGTGTNNTLARWTTSSGILADAGIVDNVVSGPGSAGLGLFMQRDFLYGRADGTLNIGDSTNRIGGVYIKNAFFVYPVGSSPGAPKAAGFLDPTVVGGVNECTRLLIAGNQSVAQGGFNQRTQITAYHALELRGNRRSTTAPSFFNVAGTDGAGVIIQQETDCVPLWIDSTLTLNNDLIRCRNFTADKFRVLSNGTVFSNGAQKFQSVNFQPGAGGTYTMDVSWRSVSLDAVNASFTINLPYAVTVANGLILDLYHLRAITGGTGSGNTITLQVAPGSGDTFIYNIGGTGVTGLSTYVLQNAAQRKAVKLIALDDLAGTHFWMVLPYNV